KRLQSYRKHAYRVGKVKTKEQAIDFVNTRGFIYFWPISGVTLPSLWVAAAGDRPVADAHDDPGHVTWGWKDSLLGARKWYYAKVLRKKATIIALDVAPYFYALSENYGDPNVDYLLLHEQGLLTQEAKQVYEALLHEGALDSVALRKAARLSSRESDSRFNKALEDLQADFKILPVGVAQAGAWRYAFIYDIVTNHYPQLPEEARPITQRAARRKLAELYFRSVGAAQMRDVVKLFGWKHADVEKVIADLTQAGVLQRALSLAGQTGEWIAVAELKR
ncbi:MAG: crosslink repair DNA glycosylase YcaQ family protein, partial [Chloroflexota bacterium]